MNTKQDITNIYTNEFTSISLKNDIENQQKIADNETTNDLNNPVGKSVNNFKNILDEHNHLNKSNSDCKDIIYAVLLIILVLAIFGGCICYYVFGIMYLVQDYDEAKDCKKSNLWAYILVTLILSMKNTQFRSNDDDKSSFLVILVCMGIIDAGMSIWGGIELFEYSCSDLENTNLFTFGLVTFILQTMVAGTSLVIVPLFTCFLAIFDK